MSASAPVCSLHRGSTALLVSLPHCGTEIPPELQARLVPRAQAVEDTDWHVAELYAFARELGASMLMPRFSRYVIDLNRPPDDARMYTGVNGTGLCPERFFSGDLLYRAGQAPDAAEMAQRLRMYWHPYHDALCDELTRLKNAHGYALLLDAHSIKSELPWLFAGQLPDLNLGTVDGTSCAPALRTALQHVFEAQRNFTHVADGRFKGGYIVRKYGRPQERVHAVQLEMCWSCYMPEAPPFRLDPARSMRLAPLLQSLVQGLLDWRLPDE